MKDKVKYADTVSLFNIFRFIIELNQYRFISLTADEVIELLLDFSNLDVSCIYHSELVERITKYCDRVDTGIIL